MTTAIALRQQAVELGNTITADEFKAQVALALPGDVTPDRFVRAAKTALLANPDIAQCEVNSIFSGLLKSAQDGLLPDGREAALVKFGDKAQYLPMVAGFRKIAAESGWQLISKIVYAADSFEHEEGLDPKLVHHPARPGDERGEIVAAYAIGRKVGQPVLFEVMDKAEIDKVRAVSRAKGGPWADWYERMAEKTVARRLFAKLPLGDRERARRVLEASALDPAESTALLYGPVRELTPAPPVDVTPEPSISSDSDGGQGSGEEAAAASAESTSTGDASSPVPDSEPEPSLEQEPAKPVASFQAPPDIAGAVAEIARVSAVRIPAESDESAGLTLQEVKEKGAVGERWLAWQLKTRKFDSIADDVERFVELVMPDLWKRYQADKKKAERANKK
jgi:recombination protein RecT